MVSCRFSLKPIHWDHDMEVSWHGGTPIAGWFIIENHGKSQSKMDDDWGYPLTSESFISSCRHAALANLFGWGYMRWVCLNIWGSRGRSCGTIGYIYIYMLTGPPKTVFFTFSLLALCQWTSHTADAWATQGKKRSSISEHLLYWLSGVCGDGPNNSGGVIGTLMPMCGAIPMGGVGGGGPGGVPGAGRLGLRDRLRSGCTRSCGSVGGALHKDLFGDKTAFTHEKGCGT